MHDEFKAWLRNDWLNIALTIFCAIIPLIPEIFWYVQGETQSSETSIKGGLENKFFYISLCQFLIALIGLFIVSLRYKPTAILDVSNQRSLQDYIEDVCNIKQTDKNDSNTAYNVVKSIVRQFYNAWIIIWVIWLAYFGVDMICHSLPEIRCNKLLRMNLFGILSLFDFLGSSALLGVYIILNHVTVDIARRTDKHYSYVYWSAIIVSLLFVLGTVLYVIEFIFHFTRTYSISTIYKSFIKCVWSIFIRFSIGYAEQQLSKYTTCIYNTIVHICHSTGIFLSLYRGKKYKIWSVQSFGRLDKLYTSLGNNNRKDCITYDTFLGFR